MNQIRTTSSLCWLRTCGCVETVGQVPASCLLTWPGESSTLQVTILTVISYKILPSSVFSYLSDRYGRKIIFSVTNVIYVFARQSLNIIKVVLNFFILLQINQSSYCNQLLCIPHLDCAEQQFLPSRSQDWVTKTKKNHSTNIKYLDTHC